VRGAASPAWSIYKDIQVGASCIIIDKGIDTGPIIKTEIVPVYHGDTYDQIVERNIFFCGELMAEVLAMFKEKEGPISGEPQDLSVGKTYKVMPPELVAEVKAKLANGTYRWLQPKPS
jgi:methionyl-tRNA formyltransferase